LFALNPTGAYVAGCEISSSTIRLVLADLEGNRIGKWRSRLPTLETPVRVIETLANGIEELMSRHSIPMEKLLGICAAVPGITEADTGRVSAPHLKQWNNVPLKALLEDRIRVHSIVENDVNLSALGEHVEGVAKNEDNFVYLSVGEGVGAGIFISGELYRGRRGTAGEIGYMQVPGTQRSMPLRSATGSLEDAVGRRGIEGAWVQGHASKRGRRLRAEQILELADSGDEKAADIVETCAAILADVVANISVLLDPSMIVLGGAIGTSALLFSRVLDRHEKNDLARPILVTSQLAEDGALIGAIKLALEHVESTLLDFA
jgi:glucokinase